MAFIYDKKPETNIEKLNDFYVKLSAWNAVPEIDAANFGGNYNDAKLESNKEISKLEKSFLEESKNNPAIFEIQIYGGLNAGMIACIFGLENIAILSLLHENTLVQKSDRGETFVDFMKKYTNWNLKDLQKKSQQIDEKYINKTISDLHDDILGL